MTYYISGCVVSDRAGAVFDAMIASGFWGDGEAEVLSSLVYLAVQGAIRDGLVPISAAHVAEFEEVEEAPEPAAAHAKPRIPKTYKCEVCKDGVDVNAPVDDRWRCLKCGTPTEIPF